MKNTQHGFIRIALSVFIALAAVGGLYWYIQNKTMVKLNVENKDMVIASTTIQSESNADLAEVKPATTQTTNSLKTFTEQSGIYSLQYPSNWTYITEKREYLGVSYITTVFDTFQQEEGRFQKIEVSVRTNTEDGKSQFIKEGAISQNIKLGTNNFTKLALDGKFSTDTRYILPISGKDQYLNIQSQQNISDNTKLNNFLSSINISPEKITSTTNKINTPLTQVELEKLVLSIRAQGEIFYSDNNTYTGMCTVDATDRSYLNKIYVRIEAAVGKSKVYCNASNDSFAYSVITANGSIICADGTGFGGKINKQPKGLTCN
jgi:hypothetical protein